MTDEQIFQEALEDFEAALAKLQDEDFETARMGCGNKAARFAYTYVSPLKNQGLYNRIYDIYWKHAQVGHQGRKNYADEK